MTQIFFNNFETTFIGPVQATPTSGTPATELGFGVLQISDGAASVLLNPTGGDFYVVTAFKRAGTVESDYEVLRITAVNNAVPGECRITVLRGQEGTTPKSYVAGDRVAMRATAGSYGRFAQNTDARLTDARTPTGGAGGVLSGTYPNPGFAVDMATQAELDAATGTREPTIAAGTVAQYWRGDKTWRDLATDVRTAALTGFSTATDTAVAAADSVLSAFGKLQAQINGHFGTGGATHPNATASVSGFLSAADKAKLDGVASGATANIGTVTSVGLAAPVEFTVTGSPVVGAGALTFTKAPQAANQFYAAPSGATGVPVFRAMVAADVPVLNQSTTGNAATATAIQAMPTATILGRISAGTGPSEPLTAAQVQAIIGSSGAVPTFAYDNRAALRTRAGVSGDQAIVEGLGLFVFATGSDEPDDDESCFATATGRWLMEAVHWDVVSTWQMPDDDARDVFDEDEPLRFDARFGARVLHGIAVNAITTLASISTASFTGTVTGAAVGDRVLITPRAEIGSTADGTARLAFYGTVSAADTVRITLVNPSAAAAAINPAVIGAGNPWSIAVLKHI